MYRCAESTVRAEKGIALFMIVGSDVSIDMITISVVGAHASGHIVLQPAAQTAILFSVLSKLAGPCHCSRFDVEIDLDRVGATCAFAFCRRSTPLKLQY